MAKILSDINLLKKYNHGLIFDYTEYPTKAHWSEKQTSIDYEEALKEWLIEDNEGNSLFYVHTPFCEQLCYFCLCSKEITKDYQKVKDYLYNVLFKEIELLEALFNKVGKRPKFNEIYFGGGSPTYYKNEEFTALKNKMSTVLDFSKIKTWTIEVDPRRVDEEKLKFYHKEGVSRLSFGIQDFDLDVQKEINRVQEPELVAKLLTPEVRKMFPVINFDLLIGLPRQTEKTIENTIKTVVDLNPTQLQTMYMHYKPDTRRYMTNMVRNTALPDFFDRRAIFLKAKEKLEAGGYLRAGFESYALKNDELSQAINHQKAYYNSLGTQTGNANNFIAVGSSAHGCFGNYYFQNFYERNLYTDSVLKGEFPVYRALKLNDEDILRRDIIKTLRTYFIISIPHYEEKYSLNFSEHFAKELKDLEIMEEDGLLTIANGEIILTDIGQHLSPHVCEVFDTYNIRDRYNSSIDIAPRNASFSSIS